MSGAATGSVWAGLGARGAADAPADDDAADRDTFEHRVVPASSAPPVSPFTSWRTAGTGTLREVPGADQPTEESTMEQASGKAPRNLQRRLGELLATVEGAMPYAQVREGLPDLSSKQLSQCLFQITDNGRARRRDLATGERGFELTARGRAWIRGDQPDAPPPAKKTRAKKVARVPAKRAKPSRKARQPRAVAMPPAPERQVPIEKTTPALARTFRCGLYSDGAYHLAKGGQQIELTVDETRAMFEYLDRIRVDDAAA